MPGNRLGGLKAARTNRLKHGDDFYKRIGKKGGHNGHTGGFAANRELAKIAGAKGGRISRRGSGASPMRDKFLEHKDTVREMLSRDCSYAEIAREIGLDYSTVYKYCNLLGDML